MPDPKPVCTLCQGVGVLPVEGDDASVQQCICTYSRALKAHLGAEIAVAPLIKKSPLFMAGGAGEPPKKDRTGENLFIKGYWKDLLPHLKWSLGCKGPDFRFRLLTDEKLKIIYLGAESYATKAKSRRDEVVTYNSLNDLVGPDIDLVIIRLGFLGYKNIAMPGILKEALMIREFACKPTWIIEVPTSIFGYGHFSYSEDVWDYISANYTTVDLVRPESASTQDTPHGIAIDPAVLVAESEDGSVGLGAREYTPADMRHMPVPKKTQYVEDAGDLPGEGANARYKPRHGKKPKGGGPV